MPQYPYATAGGRKDSDTVFLGSVNGDRIWLRVV